MKNELNIFQYDYFPWTYWKNWFRNIAQFFRNFKWAYQRATKGYCDRDIWNLDYYYTVLIRDTINALAETTHGYPGDNEVGGRSFEEWYDYLEEIYFLLDKSIDRSMDENQYYINKYEKDYQEYLINRAWETEELPNGSIKLVDNSTEEEKELCKKYFEEEKKIYKKRKKDREKAFKMIMTRFDNLWD